ncbi:hypothetical protein HPB50_014577 [Hyalomma asiaticum]|uniref:Uncharacterized protein n=1 Tax=Hyalomma asiaticum TaxID=266040 RepID=A0ACB7RTT6_HYAAI|nr:hypothetical protein HPB50_014577 [Hyalomma asiaticum]
MQTAIVDTGGAHSLASTQSRSPPSDVDLATHTTPRCFCISYRCAGPPAPHPSRDKFNAAIAAFEELPADDVMGTDHLLTAVGKKAV